MSGGWGYRVEAWDTESSAEWKLGVRGWGCEVEAWGTGRSLGFGWGFGVKA